MSLFYHMATIVRALWLAVERALFSFIIWLSPQAGKMNQIARCDWLPERARWSRLARSGLPAVSLKQNLTKSHIINSLLTKFVRSRWLNIGQYPAILTSHLVNNPYVMTGHYNFFSRLDGSFEMWVKLRSRGRKQHKRWTKYNYIFNHRRKN